MFINEPERRCAIYLELKNNTKTEKREIIKMSGTYWKQTSNKEEVIKVIEDMAKGETPGKKLKLDPKTGKLIVTDPSSRDGYTEIDQDEARMFGISSDSALVLLPEEVDRLLSDGGNVKFREIDQGEVIRVDSSGPIPGEIYESTCDIEDLSSADDIPRIRVFIQEETIAAYYGSLPLRVIVTPAKDSLFSRVKGLYETEVLAEKRVLIIGVGSGGSVCALDLVKQGLRHLILVDPDKLELGNISRHICGISDLGRFKTKAVADVLKNKNPFLDVKTFEIDITKANTAFRSELIRNVDLVICATDNRKSRLIVNRQCVENNIPCIYGGAFRRAYGGQVLRVVPNKTMCYQCFVSAMPEIVEDYEISNSSQVREIAYSDTPDIPVEPGLSIDIAPISNMISKIAMMELLRGKDHTLTSLYEDLEPSLYLWFNRREPNTQWNSMLVPQMDSIDKMNILRWYGVETQKLDSCPVCGQFCPVGIDVSFEPPAGTV